MKLNAIFIFFVSCFFSAVTLTADEIGEWKELKGEHFIVCYLQNEDFADDVLDKSEVYYSRIAADLNYPRYSEFWTWDKRVKIYIHPNLESFLKATGQPQWSRGMADYNNKQIISYAWSGGFLESLLPHEIAHLIFRDFVGFKSEIPLWLDEGVAQWAEEAKRRESKRIINDLFTKNSLLSLSDMMRLDVRNIKETEKMSLRALRSKEGEPGLLFLSGDNLVNIYYVQAVSLVGFLVERHGAESFTVFCRSLRDGKPVEEALRAAYPLHIRDIQELENKWREYLEAQSR